MTHDNPKRHPNTENTQSTPPWIGKETQQAMEILFAAVGNNPFLLKMLSVLSDKAAAYDKHRHALKNN